MATTEKVRAQTILFLSGQVAYTLSGPLRRPR